MFSLRNWFSRSNRSNFAPAAARPAAVEPLEGRALMSVSLLPAVQAPSYSLGASNAVTTSATASPAPSTNIIAILIG